MSATLNAMKVLVLLVVALSQSNVVAEVKNTRFLALSIIRVISPCVDGNVEP